MDERGGSDDVIAGVKMLLRCQGVNSKGELHTWLISPYARVQTIPSPEWSAFQDPHICHSGWHLFDNIPAFLAHFHANRYFEKVEIWLVEARGPFDSYGFEEHNKVSAAQVRWIKRLTAGELKHCKELLRKWMDTKGGHSVTA